MTSDNRCELVGRGADFAELRFSCDDAGTAARTFGARTATGTLRPHRWCRSTCWSRSFILQWRVQESWAETRSSTGSLPQPPRSSPSSLHPGMESRPCWRSWRSAGATGWRGSQPTTGDNDPVVLLSYIVAAVHRIEPIDPIVIRALSAPGSRIDVSRRVGSAIAAMHRPITIVIDHFESVTNWESRDAVAALALGLPAGSQLAIGSRDELPLPTALLRAQGGLVEIGIDDLAMNPTEAAALLHAGRGRARRGRPARARRPDRGLAGWSLPRRARVEGGRLARGRRDVHRGRPVHGRLPSVRVPRPGFDR